MASSLFRRSAICWGLLLLFCSLDLAQAQKGKKSVKGGKTGNVPSGLPPSPKVVVPKSPPPEENPEWVNVNDKLVEREPDWEPVGQPKQEEIGQRQEDFGNPLLENNQRQVEVSQQKVSVGEYEQPDHVVQRPDDFNPVYQEQEQGTETEFGRYRSGEVGHLNEQDTPPQEVTRSFVGAGQFCSTWGPHYYRTFDGRIFRYQGQCRHILFKDCIHEEVFSAVLDFSHCTTPAYTNNFYSNPRDKYTPANQFTSATECRPTAIVASGEESISIKRGPAETWIVQRRNRPVVLPVVLDTISVSPAGRHIKVKAACGAMMWISPEGSMTVELPVGWRWRTCGLCGHKDGNPRDDFQSPAVQLMTDSWSFGNSWMMRDPTERFPDGCPDPERPSTTPCETQRRENVNVVERSSEKCLPILSPKFESCHHVVDPQLYLESCQSSCCDQNGAAGCECSAIAEYFRECQRLGGRLPPEGWRTQDLCPMPCINGTVYGECVSTCAPTCYDPDPVCDVNQCLDGCHCPPGHVMHDGYCLESTLCPCSLGDKEYPGGHTIKEDCNTCRCVSGKWKCTETVCAAACRLVGNRHIVTFDGFWYELPRACSHYLLYADGYSVQIEHVPCRGSSIKGSSDGTGCGRNVVIKTRQGEPVIKLKRWLEVTADGEEIASLPTTIADVHIRVISSLYIQALLPTGVSVTWNADGSSGWISVPASFFGKTQGLCGTYTRNQADDLLTPEGDTELGPVAFARKWKSDPSCLAPHEGEVQEHPCDRMPHLRPRAEAVCAHIVTAEIFTDCLVDIAPYYGACLRELCACPEEKMESCSCPVLEQLAAECSRKTGEPLHWRTSVPHCGVHCSGGQEYRSCANACQYSCSQMSNPYALAFQEVEGSCGSGVAGGPCLDGCSCPSGQALTTLRGGVQTCTTIDQCPCLNEGREYPPGFVQERFGKICECQSGTWRCAFDPKNNGTEVDGRGYIAAPCPEGSYTESTGCLSDCPITCLNMNDPPQCHTRICKAGCSCKVGFVLDPASGQCVRPGQCPCHHGGRSYQDGQSLRMDCNNCLCKGGQWVCETGACLGKCSLSGAGHYRTFDNRVFDLDAANCAYVLLRGKMADGRSFSITAQNVPCAAASYKNPNTICKKEVTFFVTDGGSVTLSRESPVQVSPAWKLEEVGMFQHLVHLELGIEIMWDGKTRVYLYADPQWRGQFRGLCGDFNGDPTDDFVGPSDGPPQSSAHYFVDSWRIHEYCPSVSALRERDSKELDFTCAPEKQRWARHQCQVIKSELFAPCHIDVDHEQYMERCVEDACECEESGGSCDCLCTAIGAYADACAAKGIAIPWRSQDLCPIQCEECDFYSPCIPVCPHDTCQSRLENGKLECSGRPCVEGCHLKPCPEGSVRNGTSRDDACVPEELCEPLWDCIVEGKTYQHGEWVSDATVVDACRTCYCRYGELDCKEQTCPPTIPRIIEITTPEIYTEETTIEPVYTEETYPPMFQPGPTTLPPPPPRPAEKQFCNYHGWSHWINAFTPTIDSGGDFEILNDRLSRLRTHVKLPCSLSNMTSIQCRPVAPNPKGKPEDNFECSLPRGLYCKNNKALKGQDGVCRDYEIRVYCSCAPPSGKVEMSVYYPSPTTPIPETTPVPFVPVPICLPENHGWTFWINSKDGRTDPLGDFEQVESALARMWAAGGSGCPFDHVVDIQCRVAGDGRSWTEANQNDVICDVERGFACLHSRQPKGRKCLDYEIRVFCQCYTTVSTPSPTYPPAIITTESPCPPGVEWSDCPYHCDQTCKAYQHKLVIEGRCDPLDSHQCVPGCQYATCNPPFVQLDEYTCVLAADCDCVLEDGTMLQAGNIIQRNCKRCHCQNNDLFCADVPYCGMASTGAALLIPPSTACPPPATPLCKEGFTVAHDESGPCPAYRCVPECPPELEWFDCHASCERTCFSIKDRPCYREGCVAGCFCPLGKVRDGDYCKDPEECPDRVCQGFGDPQLVTFDGSIFNFQGKGLFTLANHMESSFSVSGRTEPCDGRLTCLVGLTITFKGHKVTIRRGQNNLGVDDRLVPIEQTPLEVGGGSLMILAHPGLNVLVHVPELKTEVYYFGSHAAFAIRVPVGVFFNKTKGLCGNCNKQEDDDGPKIDPEGNPDPADICTYMTEGFYGECMEENKNPVPTPDPEQTLVLCPEFDNPIFRECTRVVDPWAYRRGCARDVLQGSDQKVAACKALLEFTRQCCLVSGDILEWMDAIGCEVPCPGGSTYKQCHDSCPQTCTNATVDSQKVCNEMLTDACFCPEDTVFHNGHCISKAICESCDSEGHRPGDTWPDGACTNCQCDVDLKVTCTTLSCPNAPNCRYDENLVVDEVSDPCCLRYKCELKPVPTCPPMETPVCGPGQVARVKTGEGICPEYQCECDPALCPPVHWPADLEAGQRVEVNQVGECCSHADVICDTSLCPDRPQCPPGTKAKELPGTCCVTYKCRPPEDMCVYTPQKTVVEGLEVELPEELRTPELYHPGEVWKDGLCRNCNCLEQPSPTGSGYTSSCMFEQCPDIKDSPDKDDYLLENIPIPNNCCPHVARIFCKDDLGELHEVGSEWKSFNDTCLSYRCELSPHGDVQKVEKAIVCATCPEGHEYVPPSARLGICCGWCRPVACEEAGRTYLLGASWNSTTRLCYTAECLASDRGSGVKTVYHSPKCPMVPKECPKEKILLDETGCCQICNTTMMPMSECQPTIVPEEETLGLLIVQDPRRGTCTNDRPIQNLKQCAGNCQSHSLYSIDDGYFQSNCECCVADAFSSFQVYLKCNDRMGSILLRTFQQPTSCTCSVCSSSGGAGKIKGPGEVERIKGGKSPKNAWSFPDDSYSQLKENPNKDDLGTFNQEKILDKYEQHVFEQRPTGHLVDAEKEDNAHYEQRPTGQLADGRYEQRPTGHLTDDRYEQKPTGQLVDGVPQEPDNAHYEQRPTGQLTNDRYEQKPTGQLVDTVQQEPDNAHYEQRPTGHLADGNYEQRPSGFVRPTRQNVYPQRSFDRLTDGEGLIDARTRDLRSRSDQSDYGQAPFGETLDQKPADSSVLRIPYVTDDNPPVGRPQEPPFGQERLPNTRGQIPPFPGQSPLPDTRGQIPPFPGQSPLPDTRGQIPPFPGQSPLPSSNQFDETYNQQRAPTNYSPYDQQTGSSTYRQTSYGGGGGSSHQSSYPGSQSGYYSQSSSSHSQGNNLDEWNRQMAEHQKQVQELQNLQKTYSQLAQAQHQQQLQDIDDLNQQHRIRQQQEQGHYGG